MIFVSYQREDKHLAQLVVRGLLARGVESWIDIAQGPGGVWEGQIMRAIHNCTNVVLLLSQRTLASQVVGLEVKRALELKKNIVPVFAPGFTWETTGSSPDWVSEVQRFNGVPVSFDYPDAFLDKVAKHCIGEPAIKPRWWKRLFGSAAA